VHKLILLIPLVMLASGCLCADTNLPGRFVDGR
jgi:hypothetical protein